MGGERVTLSGLRILLAEDNPTNQLVATQMLECLGATVDLAVDGAEALEMVRRQPFDVLLVDIEMPRVNGIEVIRTLRCDPGPLARLPMIALTAYVMREHRAAIDAAGADGVIAKPILSIEQFGTEIRRFMRRRCLTRPGPDIGTARDGAVATTRGYGGAIDQDIFDGLAEAIGPEAMAELLEKVAADLLATRSRLERALAGADKAEIRAATHILISVAGAIGAMRVQGMARELNTAAHQGGPADMGGQAGIVAAGANLIAEIEAALAFLGARHPGAVPV